jgi:molecular chaperone DnaK (HSP70)
MSVTIGIDIGTVKTMMVADDGEIVLTDTGSTSRPTLVAFNGQRRLVGEEALPEISGENTVSMVNLLIGRAADGLTTVDSHRRLKPAKGGSGVHTVTVNYSDNQEVFTSTAVLGMFLAKQFERIGAVYPAKKINLAFALPPSYDSSVARAVAEACLVAGVDLATVTFTDAADCLLATYGRKLLALRGADRTAVQVIHYSAF